MALDLKKIDSDLKKTEKANAGWKHPACPRCGGILAAKDGRILRCIGCNALCRLVPAEE